MDQTETPKANPVELASKALDAFFLPAHGRLSIWFDNLWMVVLYLLGVLHWGFFLEWGKVPFDLHDWTQAGAYFSFLRQAALSGQLPLIHRLNPCHHGSLPWPSGYPDLTASLPAPLP